MSLRIIGGRLGGRRLLAPRGQGTRPTQDRAREALFSILVDVTGYRVLDLYAGSGAVGLEALSRGALRAVFVESDPRAIACLERNVLALDLAGASTVVGSPVARALRTLPRAGPFDILFADPPYDLGEAALLEVLTHAPVLLAPSGIVVLEHRSRDPSPEALLPVVRTDVRRYGEAALAFYARPA